MNIEKILYKLSLKAKKNGDIPISCIIVKDNKIIAKAYNTKYKKNDPLGHAEINAIRKAAKKLKTVNLKECTLFVNLMPCEMCQNIIYESRIKKVYYYTENIKKYNKNTEYIKINSLFDFSTEIRTFFNNKR